MSDNYGLRFIIIEILKRLYVEGKIKLIIEMKLWHEYLERYLTSKDPRYMNNSSLQMWALNLGGRKDSDSDFVNLDEIKQIVDDEVKSEELKQMYPKLYKPIPEDFIINVFGIKLDKRCNK